MIEVAAALLDSPLVLMVIGFLIGVLILMIFTPADKRCRIVVEHEGDNVGRMYCVTHDFGTYALADMQAHKTKHK